MNHSAISRERWAKVQRRLTDLPAATVKTIDRLVATKSRTPEMGSGPRIPALDRLIAAEIAAAAGSAADMPARPLSDLAVADRLFRG